MGGRHDFANPNELAQRLQPWFQAHARDLSWRRTKDPYAVWVSEIMLQQTRVDTVERYWAPFLARFPTVQALAGAPEHAVLEAWSGLGYYRRARLLHQGARFVARELGGELPAQAAALRAIPGIGPYTAGAIASIAFDLPEPLVDGNVARVLSRLQAIEQPKLQDARAKSHWKTVANILAHGRPRVLAQALMELGARVCTPKSPSCDRCPVRTCCAAYATCQTDSIPAPKVRAAQSILQLSAAVIVSQKKVLVTKRPAQGLLATMWCVPLAAPQTPFNELKEQLFTPAEHIGEIRHVFTHRIWQLSVLRYQLSRRPKLAPDVESCWLEPQQRPPGGFPRVTAKILELVTASM